MLALLAVTALSGLACAQKEGWIGRRRRAFEGLAAAIGGPIAKLQPFHERIAAASGSDAVWLDARWEACREAAPHAAALAAATLPPDEKGEPFEVAEAVKRAAGRYRDGIEACSKAEAGKAPSTPSPACLIRCMNGWSALVETTAHLREAANWVDVKMEPLGPPRPLLQLP
ncbi:Hypothetical protein CAP_0665 [Chondromyces apiculatus DSM 436]|uniref:Uncharacterized protein n=2 Tax=Chondromyces apiculatus TaxID=51 RepID=A0A017TF18_9BACT|nr:Hypothetical protein CAP_0665 [Chondromyces apiculatus DSM 436]